MSPAVGARRDAFVDEVRGFALLGIAIVNAPFLAISTSGFTAGSIAAPADRAAAFAMVAFALAKFYLLFSFLFGYSAAYLLRSGSAAERARFRRRLIGLAALGALHAVFAFVGDILMLYALLGIAILMLIRLRQRALLVVGGALLALWFGWLVLLGSAPLGALDGGAAESPAALALDGALAAGGFFNAALARLKFWPEAFGFIALINGPAVLAMFAFGLAAGRDRLLGDVETRAPIFRRAALLGIGIGLPLALAAAWRVVGAADATAMVSAGGFASVALAFAAAPPLSVGYVALLALIRMRWSNALAMFRPAGRMSLTGYLGESILLSVLFSGYGFALFGTVGALAAIGAGVAVFIALDLASRWWLRRFRQGPFEALLARFVDRVQPGERR